MFRVLSVGNFVLSLLLGSLFIVASCDDDNDDDNQPDSAEIDETSVELSGNEPAMDKCRHPDNSTRESCCKSLDADEQFIKCILLHQKKMPKAGEENPANLIKFVSCLVECVYKGKKYMGKGDSLNMKVVKADAKKKHAQDPRMQEHMIEMFAHCERHASVEWSKIKSNAAARVVFSKACKPYYMFVYMCVNNYGVKVKCPYYTWKGKKDTIAECETLKSECEKLYH